MAEPSKDIEKLWRLQEAEVKPVTLDDVRKKAAKFQRRISHRNAIEYVAAAVVIPAFAVIAVAGHGWMIQLGSALVIVAALFVVWQLHRRGAARRMPDTEGMALVDFHRRELLRQREMFRSAWLWYLAPMVPGMALILLGRWFQTHSTQRSLQWDHDVIVLAAIVIVLAFVIVRLVHALAVTKLQKQLDDLERFHSG
jgi:hypothetical protein